MVRMPRAQAREPTTTTPVNLLLLLSRQRQRRSKRCQVKSEVDSHDILRRQLARHRTGGL